MQWLVITLELWLKLLKSVINICISYKGPMPNKSCGWLGGKSVKDWINYQCKANYWP